MCTEAGSKTTCGSRLSVGLLIVIACMQCVLVVIHAVSERHSYVMQHLARVRTYHTAPSAILTSEEAIRFAQLAISDVYPLESFSPAGAADPVTDGRTRQALPHVRRVVFRSPEHSQVTVEVSRRADVIECLIVRW